jgi:hypothetical protein
MLTLLVLLAASCGEVRPPEPAAKSDTRTGSEVLQAAKQVVEAIKTRDGEGWATLVHPEKGVRFSPYAYVDVKNDVVLSRDQIRRFWTDAMIYHWGSADGTGDPIDMTPKQYGDRYIMDRDFLNLSAISVDNDRARGNTINNAGTAYPQGTRVEYYIAPSPDKGAELDWAALRLVFEQSGGSWFLVAVIHDQWTT